MAGQEKAGARRLKPWGNEEFCALLLTQCKAVGFSYDYERDEISYLEIDEHGSVSERTIEPFKDYFFASLKQGDEKKFERFLSERVPYIELEYSSSARGNGMHRYRLKGCTLDDGSFSGFIECLDDDGMLVPNRMLSLENGPELTEAKVNESIHSLRQGEKGIFLIADITGLEFDGSEMTQEIELGLRGMVDMMRADFREEDVFGRIGKTRYAAFFKGNLAIDVIEKRLQHLMEIFVHAQHGADFYSCNMGVVTTGSVEDSFSAMLKKAEMALQTAVKRGANKYRMYGDDF